MAGFSLLPKQTGTGRGQEDGETGSETSRETEKETEIRQRFGNSSSVYFQRVGFSLETLLSCSLNSSIPFFFYEDVVSFFPPPFICGPQYLELLGPPVHSGSL